MNAFIKAKEVKVSILQFGQMISEEGILNNATISKFSISCISVVGELFVFKLKSLERMLRRDRTKWSEFSEGVASKMNELSVRVDKFDKLLQMKKSEIDTPKKSVDTWIESCRDFNSSTRKKDSILSGRWNVKRETTKSQSPKNVPFLFNICSDRLLKPV